MSLLQLLTTGRCLEGLKDPVPRYRVTGQRLLPKFGCDKNPFCAREADRDAAPSLESKGPTAEPAARCECANRSASADAQAVTAPASAKSRRIVNALRLNATALRESWAAKLNGLLSRPASKPVRAAAPALPKLAVQGELSLDRIQVVRNDLSDADLEVVGAKRAPSASVDTPAPRLAEKADCSALPWKRLAARVCGVDRT